MVGQGISVRFLSCKFWLQAYAAAGTVKQNYANILFMLLRLRQACDHPILVKGFQSNAVGKDSIDIARQLPREMQINLLAHLEGSLAICGVCSVSSHVPGYPLILYVMSSSIFISFGHIIVNFSSRL